MYVKSRNAGLDVIRSIAILMVLICHIFMWISTLYNKLYGGYEFSFHNLHIIGWLGVEIFFVLSGFLIGKILIEDFVKNFQGSHKDTLLKFYTRRWFRTLPMYYLILIINIFLIINKFPELSKDIFWLKAQNYFLFLQNFFGFAHIGGVKLMTVSWSLVIEEWFYLLFPLFIIVLRSFFKDFNNKIFLKFLIYFILFISISRIIYVTFFDLRFASVTGFVFLRLDTFAVGLLLAYLHTFLPNIYESLVKKKFFLLSVALIILSYFSALYFDQNIFTRTVLFTILPFSIAVFIAFFEQNIKRKSNVFNLTSKISYSLYLIHVPLLSSFLAPFSYILLSGTTKIPVPIVFIIFFAAIYGVAMFFYRYYEKPMMDLRDNKLIKYMLEWFADNLKPIKKEAK